MRHSKSKHLPAQALNSNTSRSSSQLAERLDPPSLPSVELEALWRSLDDSSDSLPALLGLVKVCTAGRQRPIVLPRHAELVAVRDLDNKVVALHGVSGKWYTAPRVHVVNAKRGRWSGTIQVHPDTLSADLAAEKQNVACIGLNGFPLAFAEPIAAQLKCKIVDCRPAPRFRPVSLDTKEAAA